MRRRHLQSSLERLAAQYPVVTLTGPRQSGKTTLCKMTFPQFKYVSLENPDNRLYALEDPKGFLRENNNGCIIDEFQHAPDLASYIQGIVDDHSQAGQFILTGSQNLSIAQTVSQSLAGRTALLTLLPFSIAEIQDLCAARSSDSLMYQGFYPRIYDQRLDPTEALQAYVQTYIERDVRQLKAVQDLFVFRKFLKLCAGRIGQCLNLSALGNEVGISHPTVQAWLSILEASYILFRLPPYFNNFNKRVIKSPKLYFYDVGVAANILGIREPNQLSRDPLRGALFENMVIVEALKHSLHHQHLTDLYYFRDSKGNEVDLVIPWRGSPLPIEIKSSSTFHSSFRKGLDFFRSINHDPTHRPCIVYGGSDTQQRSDFDLVSYKKISQHLTQLYADELPAPQQ